LTKTRRRRAHPPLSAAPSHCRTRGAPPGGCVARPRGRGRAPDWRVLLWMPARLGGGDGEPRARQRRCSAAVASAAQRVPGGAPPAPHRPWPTADRGGGTYRRCGGAPHGRRPIRGAVSSGGDAAAARPTDVWAHTCQEAPTSGQCTQRRGRGAAPPTRTSRDVDKGTAGGPQLWGRPPAQRCVGLSDAGSPTWAAAEPTAASPHGRGWFRRCCHGGDG